MDAWSAAVAGGGFTHIVYSDRTRGLLVSPSLTSEHPETAHNSMLDLDGPAQQHLHRAVAKHLRRLPEIATITALIDARVAEVSPGDDLVRGVVHPVVSDVVFDAFDLEPELRPVVAAHLAAALGALDPSNEAARKAMGSLLLDLFRAGRQPQSGLFGDLLGLVEAGHVTHKQAIASMAVALHGGHENPVLLLASYLAERLGSTATQADGALLRLGPILAVARYARTDIEIDGCPHAAQQPFWIDLGTDEARALPFGFGPHVCPGSGLAVRLLDAWVAYDWERHGFHAISATRLATANSQGVTELRVSRFPAPSTGPAAETAEHPVRGTRFAAERTCAGTRAASR